MYISRISPRIFLHSDNGNLLAWAHAGTEQWTIGREASTHHGCRLRRGNVVGDLEREILVGSDMTCITTLSDHTTHLLGIRSTIGICTLVSLSSSRVAIVMLTDFLGTVVLVVCLARLALETGPDLCANSDTIADLYSRDLVADLDGPANDFMAYTQRHRSVAPTSIDGMDVGPTNTTAFNFDIDIPLLELLRLELGGYQLLLCYGQLAMITSCFLKFFQSSWDWTMNPSKVSG